MSMLESFLILFETDSKESAKEVDGLNKKLDETETSANDAVKGMDSASDSSGAMSASFVDAAKSAGGLIAAFMSVSAISNLIVDVASLDDHVGKMSETLDLNMQKLDTWGAAAEINGGSADSFRASVVGIATQLEDINFGGGTEILETFARMGINARNANGEARDTFDILTDVSNVFKGMSEGRSAALGRRLGLDQGTILMLQQGRYNMSELVAQQGELGGATEESYKASADFSDALANMGRSARGFVQDGNSKFLPLLTNIAKSLTSVIQWFRENEEFATGFFIAIGSAITMFALPPMIQLAVATTAATWPFILIGTAIGAAAVAIGMFYEDVKAYLGGQESLIGNLAKKYEWFGKVVDHVVQDIKDTWELLNDVFDWSKVLVDDPSAALDILKTKFLELWEYVKNIFDFSFIADSMTGLKDFFGFGEGSELAMQTERAGYITGMYNANPLNQQTYSYAYGGNSYNTNTVHMNNSINASGATQEQVNTALNDGLREQMATAAGQLSDGIDR